MGPPPPLHTVCVHWIIAVMGYISLCHSYKNLFEIAQPADFTQTKIPYSLDYAAVPL